MEQVIKRKGIKESDPFDWEKTHFHEVSQTTTNTSTPLIGQMQTTPHENKLEIHESDHVVPTADIIEELTDHLNENKGNKSRNVAGNVKGGKKEKGVIQKIQEVLDAVGTNGKLINGHCNLVATMNEVFFDTCEGRGHRLFAVLGCNSSVPAIFIKIIKFASRHCHCKIDLET